MYLREVERNLNNVRIEFRKQSFRVFGVIGILGLGLVAQDRLKEIFGNV